MAALIPDLSVEAALFESGAEVVVGLDEVGRGAWAGPVSAGAVILDPGVEIGDGQGDGRQGRPGQAQRGGDGGLLMARHAGAGDVQLAVRRGWLRGNDKYIITQLEL
jgi:ribonuclease HII